MSHDSAVLPALEGSLEERDGLTRRKDVEGKWKIED